MLGCALLRSREGRSTMPIDAEAIADRRRLRRKLSFWRVRRNSRPASSRSLATARSCGGERLGIIRRPAHRRAISIDGFIAGNQRMADLMKRVGKAERRVRRGDLHQQPGGTTTGSEELFRNICAPSPRKSPWWPSSTARRPPAATSRRSPPTISSPAKPRSSAPSACCSNIPDLSGLLSSVGVKVEEVKSAPAQGGAEPLQADAARKPAPRCKAVVNDTYDWFKAPRARAPRHGRERARNRAPTARSSAAVRALGHEARGRDRRGARCGRLARAREGRCQGPADSRLEARAATATFRCSPLAASSADLFGFERRRKALRRAAAGANSAQLDGLLAVWHPVAKNKAASTDIAAT